MLKPLVPDRASIVANVESERRLEELPSFRSQSLSQSRSLSQLTVFCIFLVACVALEGKETSRPNIVLIISDDQAWTDYGFMGHKEIQTPHLDRLASESMLFRRGYVPTPLCRPSLHTLATGLYTYQHKTSGNDPSPALASPRSAEYRKLREQLISHIDKNPTLPRWLAKMGYVSHQSGKWWEGSFARGGFTEGMTRGFPEPQGRHGDDGLKIGRQGLDPVLRFIDKAHAQKKPFFVWYAPFLPHSPHNPPARLLKKYSSPDRPIALAKYYAMCDWFDETCGELVGHIDAKGIRKNTLIIYIADNGWIQRTPETRVPEGWKHSYAPRSKLSAYEGGTRTPIMLSWPQTIQPGDRPDLVSSIDIVPTILSAAGIDVPKNLPGLDLLPPIHDNRPLDREAIFGESFSHDIADIEKPEASLINRYCIEGRWKLLLTYDGKVNRYRAIMRQTPTAPLLFDLFNDPHEKQNLAARHPDMVQRLAERIDHWWPVKERKVQTKVGD